MIDLKYRHRLSTTVDKDLYEAIYNYSIDSKIPLSRVLDEAIEEYLKKKGISYKRKEPYDKRKFKRELR